MRCQVMMEPGTMIMARPLPGTGVLNRKNVRAIWPTPRIPLIQGLTGANADSFGLLVHVLDATNSTTFERDARHGLADRGAEPSSFSAVELREPLPMDRDRTIPVT
jgi:hypothetical protein